MAVTSSQDASRLPPSFTLPNVWSRFKARVLDAEHLLVQRLAGTVFLIRVASALLAYGSQVLFARWMGSFEFGIYVYVWTWVLLLGQSLDLGLATAAQRFIPEYRERSCSRSCAAMCRGSRWIALGIAIAGRARSAPGVVRLLEPWLDRLHRHPALSRLHGAAGLCARQRAGRHFALARLGRARDRADLYRAPAPAHRR